MDSKHKYYRRLEQGAVLVQKTSATRKASVKQQAMGLYLMRSQ
ncbi:hypothetical protein [Nitrosomonas sp. Nm166]|nr:hypothetical protein [Nitrosomonas sp. Nm166]